MKKIIVLIILLMFICSTFCNLVNVLLLYKKINLLLNLNTAYLTKMFNLNTIVLKQTKVILMDSLQIDLLKQLIVLKDKQIQLFKLINDIQLKKIKVSKNNWYDNKYVYFLSGCGLIVVSSYVVKNIK